MRFQPAGAAASAFALASSCHRVNLHLLAGLFPSDDRMAAFGEAAGHDRLNRLFFLAALGVGHHPGAADCGEREQHHGRAGDRHATVKAGAACQGGAADRGSRARRRAGTGGGQPAATIELARDQKIAAFADVGIEFGLVLRGRRRRKLGRNSRGREEQAPITKAIATAAVTLRLRILAPVSDRSGRSDPCGFMSIN